MWNQSLRALLLFLVLLTQAIPSWASLHVMIDAGHGGEDHGASHEQVKESDLALAISLKLKKLLNSDPNFKSSMTRGKDQDVSLQQRVQRAHNKKADLFVSLHINNAINKKAHGLEVYFQNQLDPDEESQFLASREDQGKINPKKNWSPNYTPKNASLDLTNILADLHRNHKLRQSFILAKSVHKNWKRSLKSHSNRIYQAPFYVLTQTRIPAVLVELGFLSHAKELEKLQSDKYQQKVARALYKGLNQYRKQNSY